MDERRKNPLWPWTIRAIVISIPFLYAIATRPNGFNTVQFSVPGLAILAMFAIIASCWYRSR